MTTAQPATTSLSPALSAWLVATPWILGLAMAAAFNPWTVRIARGSELLPYTAGRTAGLAVLFATVGLLAIVGAFLLAKTRAAGWLAARPVIVKLLLAGGLAVQSLLMVDAIIGVRTAGFQFIPDLLEANFERRFVKKSNLDLELWGQQTSTDSRGFRVQPGENTDAASAHKIAFIGDSVVFGFGVADGEDLPTLLSRALGPDTVVWNRGVMGYDLQEYVLLLGNVLEEQPDEIILGICLNDLSWSVTNRLNGHPSDPKTRPQMPTPLNRARWFVRFHSGLLNIQNLWHPFHTLTQEEEISEFVLQSALELVEDPAHRHERLEVTMRYLQGFAELVEGQGDIPMRMVVFPYKFQFTEPDSLVIQNELVSMGREYGIDIVDLYPGLVEFAEARGIDPGDFIWDVNHFSALGNEALTEVIAPLIGRTTE